MKLQKLLSYVRRAAADYEMIKDGDKIAVGLSGGKDSISLLIALAKLKDFYPNHYELCAVTVSLGFSGMDFSGLREICNSLGVEYNIVNTEIGAIVFDERKEKNPCSLCSNMRKGALYNEALRLGCNVIAFGHSKDDVIETFFMSLFYEGRIHSFAPVTYIDKKAIYSIRPLIYAPEREIVSFVKRQEIDIIKNPCPANGNTARQKMKDFIKLQNTKFDSFENNIFGAIKRSECTGWQLQRRE